MREIMKKGCDIKIVKEFCTEEGLLA